MNPIWRIELLGRLAAVHEAQTLSRFRTQKTAMLLAYLAFYRQHPQPRETLIEWLWADAEPDSARHSLRQALSSLRRQLEPPGIVSGSVFLVSRNTIQLNPDTVITDVGEFHAALRTSETTLLPLEKQHWLMTASNLYQGQLLPGYYEDWIVPQQLRLEEEYVQAVLQLLSLMEAGGDLSEAIRHAGRAVTLNPVREELHLGLIGLLEAAGQANAALQQYSRLERMCAEQLNARPSPAARALAEQIRQNSSAVASRSNRATPSLSTPGVRLPLPIGTVTFLLIDLPPASGGELTGSALPEPLHALLRQQGGYEIRSGSGSCALAFGRAQDALKCVTAFRQSLSAGKENVILASLRMALHTGEVALKKDHGELGQQRSHTKGAQAVAHSATSLDPLLLATDLLMSVHPGQILCTEAAAVLLRRQCQSSIGLKPLGNYRLRSAKASERIFQILPLDEDPIDFPVLNAEPGFAGNLPVPMTRFFGRQKEIAHIRALLGLRENEEAPAKDIRKPTHDLTARLITLTGVGGSGKTRLALEVARQSAEQYQGAVWFVSLAEATLSSRIVPSIHQSLGLPNLPGRQPFEQAIEVLSEQPSLLILDSIEHLSDATEIVKTFLDHAPSLALLVTSRRLLGLSGEQEFPVAPLPIPAGTQNRKPEDRPMMDSDELRRNRERTAMISLPVPITPNDLFQFPSVQLFVDRAQTAQPDFQVTPANARAVAELCRGLEGIPLALELAAARVRMFSPAQMLGRLADRLDCFTSRHKDGAERHRTLRAAISWSYDLLSPEVQRFFARLSVFRGGWTSEAAQAITRDKELGQEDKEQEGEASVRPTSLRRVSQSLEFLDCLEQLCMDSLLIVDEDKAEVRFRMLDMLREFGKGELTSEEHDALEARHSDFYRRLAQEAGDELQGPEQADWMARLDREQENLRAALDWYAGQESGAEASLQLVVGLWWFWLVRGHCTEGRERLADALNRTLPFGATVERAKALNGASALAWSQGDAAVAQTRMEECLAMHRALENRQGISAALSNLGLLREQQGEHAAARSLHEESLSIKREHGDRYGIAITLSNLGTLAQNMGSFTEAQSLHEESLAIRQELADTYGTAIALCNLGLVRANQGHYEHASSLMEESLALRRSLGDRRGTAESLINLGQVARAAENYSRARSLVAESLIIYQEINSTSAIAFALHELSHIEILERQYVRAARFIGFLDFMLPRLKVNLPTEYETTLEAWRSQLLQVLGQPSRTAAFQAGSGLSYEDIIQEALSF